MEKIRIYLLISIEMCFEIRSQFNQKSSQYLHGQNVAARNKMCCPEIEITEMLQQQTKCLGKNRVEKQILSSFSFI